MNLIIYELFIKSAITSALFDTLLKSVSILMSSDEFISILSLFKALTNPDASVRFRYKSSPSTSSAALGTSTTDTELLFIYLVNVYQITLLSDTTSRIVLSES